MLKTTVNNGTIKLTFEKEILETGDMNSSIFNNSAYVIEIKTYFFASSRVSRSGSSGGMRFS